MSYVDHVYQIVEFNAEGIDAIYEDYILHLVGIEGLRVLKENKLLETCGVVNDKQLYALVAR